MSPRPADDEPALPLRRSGRAEEPRDKPHYAGHRDRLRRRFLTAGADSLADYELLELILFGAIPRRDVKPLAKQLLKQFGSLGGVLNAEAAQLSRRPGLSTASVAALKAAGAAATLMLREQVVDRPVIGSWTALLDYLTVALKYEPAEQLRLLFLDRKNVLITDEVQQRGTVDQTPVYPREVTRRALELHASAVIMVHNHPSGDPSPSTADIDITRQVADALRAVDIALHDHLIIGRAGHVSLRAEGLL